MQTCWKYHLKVCISYDSTYTLKGKIQKYVFACECVGFGASEMTLHGLFLLTIRGYK